MKLLLRSLSAHMNRLHKQAEDEQADMDVGLLKGACLASWLSMFFTDPDAFKCAEEAGIDHAKDDRKAVATKALDDDDADTDYAKLQESVQTRKVDGILDTMVQAVQLDALKKVKRELTLKLVEWREPAVLLAESFSRCVPVCFCARKTTSHAHGTSAELVTHALRHSRTLNIFACDIFLGPGRSSRKFDREMLEAKDYPRVVLNRWKELVEVDKEPLLLAGKDVKPWTTGEVKLNWQRVLTAIQLPVLAEEKLGAEKLMLADLRELVAEGMPIDAAPEGETMLSLAASCGSANHAKLLWLLFFSGADVHATATLPLEKAAAAGHYQTVKDLHAMGCRLGRGLHLSLLESQLEVAIVPSTESELPQPHSSLTVIL